MIGEEKEKRRNSEEERVTEGEGKGITHKKACKMAKSPILDISTSEPRQRFAFSECFLVVQTNVFVLINFDDESDVDNV